MSCDIHVFPEIKEGDTYKTSNLGIFTDQSYAVFGFLADVRNYSAIKPIAKRRGIPADCVSYNEDWDYHSKSWLSIKELSEYDYDQIVEDRRCTWGNNGGCTCESGMGEKITLREFLGKRYFKDLQTVIDNKIDRIVFGFDS